MKTMMALPLALALAACGTTMSDRALSGAAIGAGTGAVVGPVGIGAGALVGGAVGVIVPPEKVNLGEPVWQR